MFQGARLLRDVFKTFLKSKVTSMLPEKLPRFSIKSTFLDKPSLNYLKLCRPLPFTLSRSLIAADSTKIKNTNLKETVVKVSAEK